MKHGTEYAKRIKRLFNRLRRDYGKPQRSNRTDLIEQLILGILSRDTSESKAQAAQNRLRGSDAVYVAVALRFGSTLVTLDKEQHNRVSSLISARLPSEAP